MKRISTQTIDFTNNNEFQFKHKKWNLMITKNLGEKRKQYRFKKGVILFGSVLENTSIECQGDMYIFGDVDNANLSIKGNLHISGTISESTIKVAKNLNTSHIISSRASVLGNVFVENSINSSTIYTLGNFRMNQKDGSILFSEIECKGSFLASTIGSKYQDNSKIYLGQSYIAKKRIQRFTDLFNKTEMEVTQLTKHINDIKRLVFIRKKTLNNLSLNGVREIIQSFQMKVIRLKKLKSILVKLNYKQYSKGKTSIVIKNKIYPGANIYYKGVLRY